MARVVAARKGRRELPWLLSRIVRRPALYRSRGTPCCVEIRGSAFRRSLSGLGQSAQDVTTTWMAAVWCTLYVFCVQSGACASARSGSV